MTKYLDRADYGHDRSIFDYGQVAAARVALQRAIGQWRETLSHTKAERKAERRVLASLDTLAQAAGYRKPKHPNSLVWAEPAPSSPPLAQNGPQDAAEGENHTRVTPKVCDAIPDGDPEGLHTLRCGDLDPDLAQKVLDLYRAERVADDAKENVFAVEIECDWARDALRAAEARHA